MNQQALDLNLCTRRTRNMELIELMEGVVPWREFVSPLRAVAPPKATGRPPFAHETVLRLHL
jgi:transposase, IS5 family